MHGQQNDKYTEMHGQQNDKYTEMHGQQNDKYTEMHGQQNLKKKRRYLLLTILSLPLFITSQQNVTLENNTNRPNIQEFPTRVR